MSQATAALEEGTSTKKVLYCHCAHTNVIPGETKDAALEELIAAGHEFQAVPDLCQMAAHDDERLADIAAETDVTVLACYPRAVKSLFERTGNPITIGEDGFEILNMRELDGEGVVEKLPRPPAEAEKKRGEDLAKAKQDLQEYLLGDAAQSGWMPWFPVIDYDRCTHCGLCANFCIFGVYEVEDGKVRVENPESCKTECPACARVCPETAIIFPKHADSSPINGSEGKGDGEDAAVDMNSQMQGDALGFLRGRNRRARARFARRAPEAEKLCACLEETGMLSDLGIPQEVLDASAGDISKVIAGNPELLDRAAEAVKHVRENRAKN